jgi:hypothetical protein
MLTNLEFIRHCDTLDLVRFPACEVVLRQAGEMVVYRLAATPG